MAQDEATALVIAMLEVALGVSVCFARPQKRGTFPGSTSLAQYPMGMGGQFSRDKSTGKIPVHIF